jgi:uncharacterized protein YecE (DUF72 family)
VTIDIPVARAVHASDRAGRHPAVVTVRIGTSGWQYADWRGAFYPRGVPQREWLSFYAQTFDTVEVNATFYRLPTVAVVDRWATTLPASFVMTIKASRYLTHIKRLREPQEPVARLMATIAPLADKGLLGPVLIQLPPDFRAAPGLLDETLAQFPRQVRLAVEPRERSWFTDQVRQVLERHAAALVWADRGGRSLGPLWETCDWRYLRLHHGRSDWQYDDADLRRWARRLRAAGDGYLSANNDPGGAAIVDAKRMQELLA